MAKERTLSPEEMAAFDLSGRPFLHQQGSTVTRGFVVGFSIDDDQWVLNIRGVQVLDHTSQMWTPGPATDEYSGTITHEFHFKIHDKTGVVSIGGYGSETYVGPDVENPWRRVHWPATDYTGEGKLRG